MTESELSPKYFQEEPKINSVTFYSFSKNDAIAYLRVVGPMEQLGIEVIYGVENGKVFSERVEKGDLIILQRDFPKEYEHYSQIMEISHKLNKPVILDMDDILFDLPKTHPDRISHYYTESLLPILNAMLEVDLLTVPTEKIKQKLISFNQNIVVLPNFLNDRLWEHNLNSIKVSTSEKIIIGYMGSESHRHDLESISPVIRNLLEKFSYKIEFHFWGLDPTNFFVGIPQVKWLNPEIWDYRIFIEYFSRQEISIFIAPLVENELNENKSAIKFVEYSSFGVPGVYSKIEPYSNAITNGVDGFLASNLSEWENYLTNLINDDHLRLEVGNNAKKTIADNWLLKDNAIKWEKCYLTLLKTQKMDLDNGNPFRNVINLITPQISERYRSVHNTVSLLETNLSEKDKILLNLTTNVEENEKMILDLSSNLDEKEEIIIDLTTNVNEKKQIINTLTSHSNQIEFTLNEIYKSKAWKLVTILRGFRLFIIPKDSLLERNSRKFLRFFRIIKNSTKKELFNKLIVKLKIENRKLKRNNKKSITITQEKPTFLTKGPQEIKNASFDLLSNFDEFNKKRKDQYIPMPYQLIRFTEGELDQIAGALVFKTFESPIVSIIIPTHNNLKLLLECLVAIKTNTIDIGYEIIIVDDGSSLPAFEAMKKIKNVEIIHNSERIGYTISCNLGAKKSKGNFVLFLNDDTQIGQNWLAPLVGTFSSFQGVGAVGPKVVYPNGYLQEAGCSLNQDGKSIMTGYGEDPGLKRYNFIREVDYCSGVCLLVPRELFFELGCFDEAYAPAYYEDSDLCMKIHSAGLKVVYNPLSFVVHHLSATTNKLSAEFKLNYINRNRQKFLEKWNKDIHNFNKIKLIAFYLPQFHPTPENDSWWGKGFTEWRNVVRGKPNYVGHYQPHLPKDIGFYDLRIPEVMEKQAALAEKYGIFGFCYYYYWFGGKRILEMPLERILSENVPDFPFCLCWANENWTRRWDGKEDEILLSQNHSEEDDLNVIKDFSRYFSSPNYIHIDGKPIFLIYRVSLFPNITQTTEIWRNYCRENGIGEILLGAIASFELAYKDYHPNDFGMDFSVEFPPHELGHPIVPSGEILNPDFKGQVFDYRMAMMKNLQKPMEDFIRYKTVMPSWDNTARSQNKSHIFEYATPLNYQAWLTECIKITKEQYSKSNRYIFINAWNEWAEGNYLEPDEKNGYDYLNATRNALDYGLIEDFE